MTLLNGCFLTFRYTPSRFLIRILEKFIPPELNLQATVQPWAAAAKTWLEATHFSPIFSGNAFESSEKMLVGFFLFKSVFSASRPIDLVKRYKKKNSNSKEKLLWGLDF